LVYGKEFPRLDLEASGRGAAMISCIVGAALLMVVLVGMEWVRGDRW